ncbi:hypothetical protein AN641_08300 [Candidatus Epulonipiscioides gigas]|nr:hypothetical protein AN641_08300 [Epulopiscium sp. SCG-C07WGA-EpuloA2]
MSSSVVASTFTSASVLIQNQAYAVASTASFTRYTSMATTAYHFQQPTITIEKKAVYPYNNQIIENMDGIWPGQRFDYVITITNHSLSHINNVGIVDAIPDIVSLKPGASFGILINAGKEPSEIGKPGDGMDVTVNVEDEFYDSNTPWVDNELAYNVTNETIQAKKMTISNLTVYAHSSTTVTIPVKAKDLQLHAPKFHNAIAPPKSSLIDDTDKTKQNKK